ncbi:siderophore-interacting protein [Moellerella wisconsensis]|uniref:siderophore-interacting protein n=1 Tax=Moellerella wisconsensis TaxID=158849 RepID=UPI00240EFAD6|nr:siderophore-interacting protein [Moellerella wisconsensis]
MATANNDPNRQRPIPPQLIHVKSIIDISPAIRRITFHGENLDTYPANCAGAHLKIFLSADATIPPLLPVLGPKGPSWPEDQPRPKVRTYTVRAIRPAEKEIDIEFAMHEGMEGPAYQFARDADIGHWLGISRPGGAEPLLSPASHYFMAGDASSLPAIAALLENMPENAQGKVILRVDNQADIYSLQAPEQVEIVWICGDISTTEQLINCFKTWTLPTEDIVFWFAGEEQIIKPLRRYIRHDKGYDRQHIHAVPYWRHGYNEEGYHQMRHDVMDSAD